MKKFQEHKGPLQMLKAKMMIKAEAKPEYKCLADELMAITTEQDKFFEECHWSMALAEATDKVQDIVF